MTDIESLRNLLEDEDLKKLEDSFKKNPNIFSILKVETREIRHSNMLAWLLNPDGNHNLGTLFLKELIKATKQKVPKHLDYVISREWKNMDLLLVNEKEKLAIAIENKIHASEHDNQLERYYNTMQSCYPDYKVTYVYLTLDGDEAPYLSDIWKPMSYKTIIEILDKIIAKNELNETVNLIINNYIETVRSLMDMENPEIRELCMQIYDKHKRAIDLIIENMPEDENIFLLNLGKWIRDEWSKKYHFKNVNNHKWFEFFSDEMDKILPNINGKRPYKYFLSIEGDICKIAFELQYEGLDDTPTLEFIKEADKRINNHNLGKSLDGKDIKWSRYAFKTWRIDISNIEDDDCHRIKEKIENVLFKEIPSLEKDLKN